MLHVEFEYASPSGHTWRLHFPRHSIDDAIDAIFRWFTTIDEFGVAELGLFCAAILSELVDQGRMHESSYRVVQRSMQVVAQSSVQYAERVNLMREILRSAIDSTG